MRLQEKERKRKYGGEKRKTRGVKERRDEEGRGQRKKVREGGRYRCGGEERKG